MGDHQVRILNQVVNCRLIRKVDQTHIIQHLTTVTRYTYTFPLSQVTLAYPLIDPLPHVCRCPPIQHENCREVIDCDASPTFVLIESVESPFIRLDAIQQSALARKRRHN